MKTILIRSRKLCLALSLVSVGCSTNPQAVHSTSPAPVVSSSSVAAHNEATKIELPSLLPDEEAANLIKAWGFQGTFVLWDTKANRLYASDLQGAKKPWLPASTFKMANTLIGLETGVIPDEKFTLPWDKQPQNIKAWEQDHDLASAMKYSVVWYYQEVARRIGQQRMQHYVNLFDYGNKDISGGIDQFWLDGALRITPLEQLVFMEKVRRRELPISKRNIEILEKVTTLEKGDTWAWRGKTGLYRDETTSHGWLVGTAEKDGSPYNYALLLYGDNTAADRIMPSRKPLARAILTRKGVLPEQSTTALGSETKRIEMAVTVDDLPSHGKPEKGQTRLQIHEKMIKAFEKHSIKGVVGFVNGKKIDESPNDKNGPEAWVKAGHILGNHTWSHGNLHKMKLEQYLDDIDKNDSILNVLVPNYSKTKPKYFRYPFLIEGTSLESRAKIRHHLEEKDYTIAEVTDDFGDWAYSAPYIRCLEKNDTKSTAQLKKNYLRMAQNVLEWNEAASNQILGKKIPHVLLLHVGAFTAEMLDDLLTMYEKQGVTFISLATALEDPALKIETGDYSKWGSSLLEQIVENRKVAHPPLPQMPLELLQSICSH